MEQNMIHGDEQNSLLQLHTKFWQPSGRACNSLSDSQAALAIAPQDHSFLFILNLLTNSQWRQAKTWRAHWHALQVLASITLLLLPLPALAQLDASTSFLFAEVAPQVRSRSYCVCSYPWPTDCFYSCAIGHIGKLDSRPNNSAPSLPIKHKSSCKPIFTTKELLLQNLIWWW